MEHDGKGWSMFSERLLYAESEDYFNNPDTEEKVFEAAWQETLRVREHTVELASFGPAGFEKEMQGGRWRRKRWGHVWCHRLTRIASPSSPLPSSTHCVA